MNDTSHEIRLREIANRCESVAFACFDLTAAARLREAAAEIRGVADRLALASHQPDGPRPRDTSHTGTRAHDCG